MDRMRDVLMRRAGLVAVVFLAVGLNVPCQAQNWSPMQIALFNPVQAVPETHTVNGLRLDILYGRNENVHGLDLGLVNEVTKRTAGVQIGLFDMTEMMDGLQLGIFSGSDNTRGLQIGVINKSGDTKGLQVGLFNFTRKAKGVQIGLINVIDEGPLRFFPIINMSF